MSCTTPIPEAVLVDYWAGDLATTELEAVEDHLFGCASCTSASAQIARVARALRTDLPSVVTRSQVDAMQAQGLVVLETEIVPASRTAVTFARDIDLMIHRLGGLQLASAGRVHVMIRTESTGAVVVDDPFAPFDAQRGEVLIACQRHFAELPHDVQIVVKAHRPGVPPLETVYTIPHTYVI